MSRAEVEDASESSDLDSADPSDPSDPSDPADPSDSADPSDPSDFAEVVFPVPYCDLVSNCVKKLNGQKYEYGNYLRDFIVENDNKYILRQKKHVFDWISQLFQCDVK